MPVSPKSIILTKPLADQQVLLQAKQDTTYILQFNHGDTTFDIHGNDFIITFNDNAGITLVNFVPLAATETIFIQTDTGDTIQANDLVTVFLMDQDSLLTNTAEGGLLQSSEEPSVPEGNAFLPFTFALDTGDEEIPGINTLQALTAPNLGIVNTLLASLPPLSAGTDYLSVEEYASDHEAACLAALLQSIIIL